MRRLVLVGTMMLAAAVGCGGSDGASGGSASIRVRVQNTGDQPIDIQIGPANYGEVAASTTTDYLPVDVCENEVVIDGMNVEPVEFCCAEAGLDALCSGTWTYHTGPDGRGFEFDAGGGGDLGSGGVCMDADLEADNCWKRAVREANACLDASATGVLSADRTLCTYPDGSTVQFAEPTPTTIDENYVWDFSIVVGGEVCADFLELSDGGYRLATASGETEVRLGGVITATVTCPDGSGFDYGLDPSMLLGGCDYPGITYAGAHVSLLPQQADDTMPPAPTVNCQ